MTRVETDELGWFSVVVRARARTLGMYIACWAHAASIGEAIALAEESAIGIDLPELAGARPADVRAEQVTRIEEDEVPEDAVPQGEHVLVAEAIDTWEIAADDGDFWFPEGVIPSSDYEDEGSDPDDIVEGYEIDAEKDGRYTAEVCIDQRRVRSVLERLLGLCPDAMIVRVVLMDKNGEPQREWRSRSPMSARGFVGACGQLLRHGLLYLSFRADDVIVTFTDHKTFLFTGPAALVQGELAEALADEGLSELDECRTLNGGYGHYHYVPQAIAPLGEDELGTTLTALGLVPVE